MPWRRQQGQSSKNPKMTNYYARSRSDRDVRGRTSPFHVPETCKLASLVTQFAASFKKHKKEWGAVAPALHLESISTARNIEIPGRPTTDFRRWAKMPPLINRGGRLPGILGVDEQCGEKKSGTRAETREAISIKNSFIAIFYLNSSWKRSTLVFYSKNV